MIISWSDALRDCVERIKALSAERNTLYLFCTRNCTAYTDNGFNAIWQRIIRKAHETGLIQERFRFHDIRRKAATDAERLAGREYARQLLGHDMQSTTAKYISGAQTVKPLK